MASSLFANQNPNQYPKMTNALFERHAREMRKVLKNNDPRLVLEAMMMQDSQINAFVQQHKDKSLQQLSEEFGVDYKLVQSLIK